MNLALLKQGFTFKQLIFYGILLISVYLVGLIYFMPAKWFYQQLVIDKLPKAIKLQQIEGTLWQGSAWVKYQRYPKIQTSWNVLNWDSLFKLEAKNNFLDLRLLSNFQGFDAAFKLSGTLDAEALTRQIKLPNKTRLSGSIELQQVDLLPSFSPYYISSAQLHWSGGQVRMKKQQYSLPALNVIVTKQNQGLEILLQQQDNSKKLIQIQANNNKELAIQISQRFLTLSNQGQLSENPDEYVIRVKEKLQF